jgi:sugar phosphate isomerase/epimerase
VSTTNERLRVAVVLEAFLDRSLDEVMDFLAASAPDVTDLEVGAGGYAPHPHCDTDFLLSDADERQRWLGSIAQRGFNVAALNAWGNPLHPDRDLARSHDQALRNAIRLATELGVDRVVAMAGCPAATPGDASPHFAAGGWLPFLEGVYEKQWTDVIEPYWSSLADFARSENPDLLVCLELHPGTSVFNVETFERLAKLGPSLAANLDPSHFMWMGMDGHKVASRIADRVGHIHGKDTAFHSEQLALNGVLDRRWPNPAEDMPWTFAVPGRGHDLAWWTELLERLSSSRAHVVSIEHEDPFVSAEEGVPEAARLLRAAIDKGDREVAK